jgi:hypothetical protein
LVLDGVVDGYLFIIGTSGYVPAVLEIDDASHCGHVGLNFAGDCPGTDVPKDQ